MITKAELDKMVEEEADKNIQFPKKGNTGCYQTMMVYEVNDYTYESFKSGASFVTSIFQDEIEMVTDELKLTIAVLKAEATINREANEALRSINKGIAEATLNLHKELSEANATIQSLKDENKKFREALEYYAAKCNWVDLYFGANLPLNLRKQSVIKGEDISVVSESAGYENECGGRLARQTLEGVSK